MPGRGCPDQEKPGAGSPRLDDLGVDAHDHVANGCPHRRCASPDHFDSVVSANRRRDSVSELNRARAHILLCDAAQAIGGKLFILGGGWSKVWGPGPYVFALAVQLWLPWNQANE